MPHYMIVAVLADGTGERHISTPHATSLSEGLALAERADAGKGEYRTFGIRPEDFAQARAEGIDFNEADGLLL